MIRLMLLAVLVGSGGANAQSTKKKDWLFLLPAKVRAEVTDDEAKLLSTLTRAYLVKAFDEKNIPIVSPVQMAVTERELHVNLAEDGGWTMDLYNKLHDRWGMRYLSTIAIVESSSTEGPVSVPPGSPPPPGGQLTTTVKIIGSLYDFKTRKYIFENKEALHTSKMGRPGPFEQQVTEEKTKALQSALKELFKPFLSKLPNKPPSVGLGAGGG
jgi:hypothetical protein